VRHPREQIIPVSLMGHAATNDERIEVARQLDDIDVLLAP